MDFVIIYALAINKSHCNDSFLLYKYELAINVFLLSYLLCIICVGVYA